MPAPGDLLARLKIAVLRRRLEGDSFRIERRLQPYMDLVSRAGKAQDTMELIRIVDELYNGLDEKTKEETIAFINKYKQGRTILFTTHCPADIEIVKAEEYKL